MKVLHISTFDVGGAAKAAIRLHKGLLGAGVDSNFLSLFSSKSDFSGKYQHHYTKREKVLEYARIKWRFGQNRKYERKIQENQNSLEFTTLPNTSFDITKQDVYKEADVVNLHWISSYLDYPSFWKKNEKPVVWTLHDMNPFCGIYHYQGDATSNRDLTEINDEVKKRKDKLYQKAQINVVCPSKWLLKVSASSQLLKRFPHHHIPYGLDTTVFTPQDRKEVRRKLALPKDKKILLFVSQNVSNYRKGYDLLLKALSQIDGLDSFQAVTVGMVPRDKHDNIIYLGSIDEESKMAEVYAAADAFIMPSREDNLPNVMLESLACGTPVICFPVGGMLDVIDNGFNGYLCPDTTAESLAQTILRWVNNSSNFNQRNIRNRAVSLFSEEIQARRYIDLYQKIYTEACVAC